jgi:hypothetical protein
MTSRNKHEKLNGRKLTRSTPRDCKSSQRNEHAKRGAFYDQSIRQRLNMEAKVEIADAAQE